MEKILPLLSNLSFEELSNLCATNSEYQKACENDQIWETLYHRDFGSITDRLVVSWKFEYLLQKSQPNMSLVDKNTGLIQLDLPYFPSAKIQKIVYIQYHLLVLEESGNLYYTNLSNPEPYRFQQIEGRKFSTIGNRSGLALSDEGKLLILRFADRILVDDFSDLAPELSSEVFSEIFDGFQSDSYLITSRSKNLFYISYQQYPVIIQQIGSDVNFVYPLINDMAIIMTGFSSGHTDYLRTAFGIQLLIIDGVESRGQIKDVQGLHLLSQSRKLYTYDGVNFVDWTKQMGYFDYAWKDRFIEAISDNHLLLTDGSVWSISGKSPVSLYEIEQLEMGYRSPDEFRERVLPKLVPFSEPIILMAGRGFFGKQGTFYISEYWGTSSGKFDYGFRPKFLSEIEPSQKYAFWKNHKLTISLALFLLLLEKGIISRHPDDRHFYYQNHEINVASN